MGCYTQGDENMERNYNHHAQEKYLFNNNKILYFFQIPASYQMPYIQYQRPPLSANDKKMSSREQMPANNQKRVGWIFYKTAEEFMAAPNFRKDIQEYRSTCSF